jgi:hypothetical protein
MDGDLQPHNPILRKPTVIYMYIMLLKVLFTTAPQKHRLSFARMYSVWHNADEKSALLIDCCGSARITQLAGIAERNAASIVVG